jgi:type II secretory pathway component GspD/PulD (secretin)
VFQANLRGWRRLAAGLVLVPGLTGLGADALGLLGRAAAQDRPAARTEEARDLMRRAREAYDAQNYGLARELAEKAKALRAPAAFYDDQPEDMLADLSKKPGAKSPAAAAGSRPMTQDPKALMALAKSALDAGDLDRAQDLATQAQAHEGNVRWGIFEDTPRTVLRDVQKARGRRDRDTADKLLAEARFLYEKPAPTKTERANNLMLAEEKAKQAASLHGSYSMWDFGDRPGDIITDVRKTREKEKLAAVRPGDTDEPGARKNSYGGRRILPDDGKPAILPASASRSMDGPRTADGGRKKAAVALMQEGKALEVGGHYAEARKKYVEASRLNASFAKDEDTPEGELSRLNVAVQRKINSKVDEARSCVDRKDATAAQAHLDEAHQLCVSMGLDASCVVEVEMMLKPKGPMPVIRTGTRPTDDGPMPIIRTGGKPTNDGPMPIIRTGAKPGDDQPMPIIRTGRRPGDDAADVKAAAGDDAVKIIPPAMPEKTAVKAGGEGDLPPLPPVPDVKTEAAVTKPPMTIEPPAAVKLPVIRNGDGGQQLLETARTELKKGDTESAKKVAIEILSGSYACKDEAAALLQSIETKEAEQKLVTAKRAFDNGMEAYHTHNYAQALAIFKQIDGMLLPAEARKKLNEMIVAASAKQQEMADAAAARTGEKLPAAPRPAVGVPDLPLTGPAPVVRTGPDSMLKQQEALTQVEFQRLRAKALKVESEATARFGRGETDAALQDLQNFTTEVKASTLEPTKQNLICRPIEARMERLRILKHQTDFLTKESHDRRNFKAEMTHEALDKEKKHEEVAQLLKQANKLMEDHKYKEAYAKVQMAQTLDPDDASVNGQMQMAERMYRMMQNKQDDKSQENFNWERMREWHDYPNVTDKDPLRWSEDKDHLARMRNRGPGSIGLPRLRSEGDKSIERKLSTPVDVSYKAMALDAVVEHLHTMTAINFDLDLRSLKEGNVDPKQPITADLKQVSLKSALEIICRQAGLKHLVQNEAIRITTPKGAAGQQMVKSIPVGDLVIPAPNYGATPGLTLSETLKMAAESAFGMTSKANGSSLKTPASGLSGGTGVGAGSMADTSEMPNRLRNTPREGGASSNTGPAHGTLERELIRLITQTIKPDSWASMGGEGSIEYYPLGLALVINQSPEVIEEVERLLESLRRLQDLEVSIEVKVVSLSELFYERIGVDFSMGVPTNAQPVGGPQSGQVIGGGFNRNFSGNVIGLQAPGIATPDLDIPIRATSFQHAVPPFGGYSNSLQEGGIALGLAFLSDIQVQMFLEAAQGDQRTNVMQAPKLTALNGTSASMTVGDYQFFVTGITPVVVNGQLVFTPQNVPFLVGQTQPIPPNASIQNGLLNFTPTAPQTPGLGLFIQPVVSADRRFVRLNIQQSFTNLISGIQSVPVTTIITPQFENGGTGQPVPFTTFLQQPRFSNLETQTVVVVPDGGTVVMGGLKWMTEGRNEFGPPVLSKIPYLNRLFKNVSYGREGRSILIMVTPRVIINREEQERQTGVREDDLVGFVGP